MGLPFLQTYTKLNEMDTEIKTIQIVIPKIVFYAYYAFLFLDILMITLAVGRRAGREHLFSETVFLV